MDSWKIIGKTAIEMGHILGEAYPQSNKVARLDWHKRAVEPYQGTALFGLVCDFVPRGGSILEIGTAHGYSTAIMAQAAPTAFIETLNPLPHEVKVARLNLAPYENVEVIQQKSWDYLRDIRKHPAQYDLIFVDGDHARVGKDLPWWDFVKPGGVMVFHDYSPEGSGRPCPPVYEAVNEFAALLGKEEPDILIVDDQQIGLAGFIKPMTGGSLSDTAEGACITAQTYSINTMDYLRGLYEAVSPYKDVDGDVVEFGCQNGGAAALMGHATKKRGRKVYALDTFEGVPQPDAAVDGNKAYGKWERGAEGGPWGLGTVEGVEEAFKALNVASSKQVIVRCDWRTEPFAFPEQIEQIAVAHIDATLYSSTLEALKLIEGRMVAGGLIVVGAYWHWPGVKSAVDEFYNDRLPANITIDKGIVFKLGESG